MTIQKVDVVDVHALPTDSVASGDFLAFSDENEAGDPSNKVTIDNFVSAIAGTGLSASGIQLSTSGSGATLTGSTDNTVCTVTGADAIQGEANLTFNGNTLGIVTGSSAAVPLTVTGASGQSVNLVTIENSSNENFVSVGSTGTILLGIEGTRKIQVENVSGSNVAGKHLDLRSGKSTGSGLGGSIRLYTAGTGAGSATGVNNHSEVLRLWYDKKVDFKIATVDGSTLNTMSAAAYLPIKVGGTDYFLPLYEEM